MNLKEFPVGYLSLMLAASYLYQVYVRPKFYPPEAFNYIFITLCAIAFLGAIILAFTRYQEEPMAHKMQIIGLIILSPLLAYAIWV
ncbi:hypothetical protein EDM00_06955 [Ornithobacterium rhinotracheale]|uniref:hypothetical protein n=1 Tax=Ornithobacterium rhinotracheale TaxID=28251 RepID=UPI00129C22E6|nr:hypothetical protein [Ornithobacterium rhinotracheale]MRI63728.1 hypothetical protein [Ornithobacterium rhinotracheale]